MDAVMENSRHLATSSSAVFGWASPYGSARGRDSCYVSQSLHCVIGGASSFLVSVTETDTSFLFSDRTVKRGRANLLRGRCARAAPGHVCASQVEERRRFRGCLKKWQSREQKSLIRKRCQLVIMPERSDKANSEYRLRDGNWQKHRQCLERPIKDFISKMRVLEWNSPRTFPGHI